MAGTRREHNANTSDIQASSPPLRRVNGKPISHANPLRSLHNTFSESVWEKSLWRVYSSPPLRFLLVQTPAPVRVSRSSGASYKKI